MDLEQQSLQEHDKDDDQQQQVNEGPRRPRLQSVTLAALPGPLQAAGPLDLDLLPLHHEVLPQPESGHRPPSGSAASTLLVPAPPSSFPLLQQLQEDATNLNEGIAPLPIAPLPNFVGVPLPVAVETPQSSVEDPSATVALTVLQHPQGTHGTPLEAPWKADDGENFQQRGGVQNPASPQQGTRGLSAPPVLDGPRVVPEGPLLPFLLGPRSGNASLGPLSEGLERESVVALNSPASAPASVVARSFPGATTVTSGAPCVRSCVSAVGDTAYEEEPLEAPRGVPPGPSGGPTAEGPGLPRPTSIVFLPGGSQGNRHPHGRTTGKRREEQHVWNSGILGVFTAQAVACAVACVYGMQINSKAIFITNTTGFFAELCWIAVWAFAQQQQNDSRPLSRSRLSEGGSSEVAPSWIRGAVGTQPSTAASPHGGGNSLQRRGPQRAPKIKSTNSTVASPRHTGQPSSAVGGPPSMLPKGNPLAVPPRSKRPFQQQHNAVTDGNSKGPSNAGGPSALSLNHSSNLNTCVNRVSSSNSSSEGTGDHSRNSTSPTEAGPISSHRRWCSGNLRPRRRRGQQLEPSSYACLSAALSCARWFGLLLFLSAPLFLFLLLLPVTLVGWLQVPASLCLFGAHVPRLVSRGAMNRAKTALPMERLRADSVVHWFMIRAKSHECLPLPLILMGVLCNGCWALLGYVSGLAAVCCVGVVGYLFSALQMHVIWWSKGTISCIDFDFLGDGSRSRGCRSDQQPMLMSRLSPRQ
ncbi:hypothetical protein Efla_000597 [Eimeria flavescens]